MDESSGPLGFRASDPVFYMDPLASASLRYSVRVRPRTTVPSAPDLRPFSLHHAVERPKPVIPSHRYSESLQVAVLPEPDSSGEEVPLIWSGGNDDEPDGPGGKKWRTKMKSDGEEGEEEEFGWEEVL